MKVTDLDGRLTITIPEAGQLLGISRDVAYRAAHAKEIPTLQIGRRLVVPTAKLLELLGVSPPTNGTAALGGAAEKSDPTTQMEHKPMSMVPQQAEQEQQPRSGGAR